MSVVIESKYDGLRMTVHRDHEEVKLFTEDELRERQQVLPQVVEAVKEYVDGEEIILDAEFVLYEDGKPQAREEMLELVVGKDEIKQDIKVFVHDCVYDGKPINEEGYLDRIKHVHKIIRKNDILIPSKYWVATNKEEFMDALDKAYEFPGSEGSMLKAADSQYLPGVHTTVDWAKIKVTQEYAGQIIGISKKAMSWEHIDRDEPSVKPSAGKFERKETITGEEALKLYKKLQADSNTYKFRVAVLKNDKLIPMESKVTVTDSMQHIKWNASLEDPKWQGTDDPRIWEIDDKFPPKEPGSISYANTYNKGFEDIKPELGMIITVAPKKIIEWEREGKTHYSHMFPKVKEMKPEREAPDDIEEVL